MAYRPAGGACTALLVVDMTAVPFMWDQGASSPEQSRCRSRRRALNMW